MQLQMAPNAIAPSALEVADYVASMAGELAIMARRAGLEALGRSLEDTQRMASVALGEAQLGKAAPDDAA